MKAQAMTRATSMARKMRASIRPQDGPWCCGGGVAWGGESFCGWVTRQCTAGRLRQRDGNARRTRPALKKEGSWGIRSNTISLDMCLRGTEVKE